MALFQFIHAACASFGEAPELRPRVGRHVVRDVIRGIGLALDPMPREGESVFIRDDAAALRRDNLAVLGDVSRVCNRSARWSLRPTIAGSAD